MDASLNPSPVSRVVQWLRPDWTRTVAARRIAAAGLVVLAGIAALRSAPDTDHAVVVVAARDLRPGTALTAEDVRLENRSTATVPDGASTDLETVIGATLAGPARRSEVLTDVRLLGTRLAESSAGPGARLVPLHPADPALADLVRPGDVVDVVASATTTRSATDPHAGPRIVATNAVVVLVSDRPKTSSDDRVVLVAVPAGTATAVAGAALTQTVTLALH